MLHKIMTLIVTTVLGLALNGPAIASNAGGAVYAMTNAAVVDGGNEIVIYNRANDGHLTLAGRVATGGDGSGVNEPDNPPDDA